MTARWFQSGLALPLATAVVGVSIRAFAASDSAVATPLVVEREASAASCPNAEELEALVESVRGGAAPASVRYGVRFSRAGAVFHARIEDLSRRQVRDLDDDGANCSGITRATVVTLALLFDAEFASTADGQRAMESGPEESGPSDVSHGESTTPTTASVEATTSEAVAAKPPSRVSVAPNSSVAPSWGVAPSSSSVPSDGTGDAARDVGTASGMSVGVMVGGEAVMGVAAPYALGPSAALALAGSWLRAEVSAFWSPPQPRDFGGGTIRTELFTGSLTGCFSPGRPFTFRFDVCTGITAGQLTARARGYARDGESHRPWVAVPAALSLTSEGELGWQVLGGLLLPVQREDFRIAGLGQGYESWAVAGFLGFRLGLRTAL